MQFCHPDEVTEKAPSGCYVSGLYLEGARWDLKERCLAKSLPKVLIEELPILRVIPIEAHRLKLVVSDCSVFLATACLMVCVLLYYRIHCVLRFTLHLIVAMQWESGWCFKLILLQMNTYLTGCSKVYVCYSTQTESYSY